MNIIFLYLILGHLLADFVFQPDRLIVWKNKNWKGILVHAVIHFVTGFLLLLPFGALHLTIPALGIIAVLHFMIDRLKIFFEHQNKAYVKFFFIDQVAHFSILIAAALIFLNSITIDEQKSWLFGIYSNPYFSLYLILAVLLSYGIDIIRLQFLLQKNSKATYAPNYSRMLQHLIILSVFFGIGFFVFKIL